MSDNFEICISQGGKEIRLPPIKKEQAQDAGILATALRRIYPGYLVELVYDGLRYDTNILDRKIIGFGWR